MIRKILCALLCISLMLCMLPALAEDAPDIPLFRLMDVAEDGSEHLIGSAVLFADNETLLTTVWAMQFSGTVKAVGPDGDYSLAGAVMLREDSELVLLSLDHPCEAAQPMQLLSSGTAANAALLAGLTRDGKAYSAAQSDVKSARYGDLDACLVSGPTSLIPGAVLLDEKGMLSGMVVAAWGEKPGYFAALTRTALAKDFIALQQTALAEDNWLDQPVLTYEAGTLTIDWSAEVQTTADSHMHVYVFDESNPFYSWYLVSGERSSFDLPVTPGRNYRLWLQHSQSEDRDWDNAPMTASARIDIPQAQPLTAHSFQSLRCYLASAPAQETVDPAALLPEMTELTPASLTDESLRLYLQVTDTYQVAEEIETSLTIALTTPGGQCFSLLSGYIYMPSLSAEDIWNAEVTDILRGPVDMGVGFVPGEYCLAYYIGGELAGEMRFVIE